MSASQVETLCRPSHPYKSLRKVTCRRVTSRKASDTAGLHCRAGVLAHQRGRLHCMRAGIYLGDSHWALEGCSGERQEGAHREAQSSTCPSGSVLRWGGSQSSLCSI